MQDFRRNYRFQTIYLILSDPVVVELERRAGRGRRRRAAAGAAAPRPGVPAAAAAVVAFVGVHA